MVTNNFEELRNNMEGKNFEAIKTVNLGEELRKIFGIQSQYAVRYFDKNSGNEFLGEGLNITGDFGNYHDIQIAESDLPIAIQRMHELFDSKETDKSAEKKDGEGGAPFLPDWAK